MVAGFQEQSSKYPASLFIKLLGCSWISMTSLTMWFMWPISWYLWSWYDGPHSCCAQPPSTGPVGIGICIVHAVYTSSQEWDPSAPCVSDHIHKQCLLPWGPRLFYQSQWLHIRFGWNMHHFYVESHKQSANPVIGALYKGYSGHPSQFLPLWMGPPFGAGGLVDVQCTVIILSGSLLEMMDFSIEAFRVTDDLGLSG